VQIVLSAFFVGSLEQPYQDGGNPTDQIPFFPIGSDASYDSGTVFSLYTIFFLRNLFLVVLQLRPPAGTWQTTTKKEEGELKQRRKQEEAAQGDPEPGKGNQEKEKDPSRVQSWGSAGQKTQKKTRRMEGDAKHTKNGGETHIVAVVETRAASIEARQREANTAEEPCWRAATNS